MHARSFNVLMSREKMLARGNTGRNRLDSLRLGSSREDKFSFFGGGGDTLLSGARGIRGEGEGGLFCIKVTANEGGSFKNVSEPYGEIR